MTTKVVGEWKPKSYYYDNELTGETLVGLFYGVYATFNISVIVTVSFIGGGNLNTPKNHWPIASHWQTLSHNVVMSTPRMSGFRTYKVSGDRQWFHRKC